MNEIINKRQINFNPIGSLLYIVVVYGIYFKRHCLCILLAVCRPVVNFAVFIMFRGPFDMFVELHHFYTRE